MKAKSISQTAPARLPTRGDFQSRLRKGGFFKLRFIISLVLWLGSVFLAFLVAGTLSNPFNPTTGSTCDIAVIVNGGFETGDFTGWVGDGDISPLVVSDNPRTGSYSAFAGNITGPEPAGDTSFYQEFTVPATGGMLSFWHWDFSNTTILFDWQDAYITDTNGNILQLIFHLCANGQAWLNQQADMTPYRGQTVRIKFVLHQGGEGHDTAMYVDDVSLVAGWLERAAVPYNAAGIFAASDGTFVYAGGGAATDGTGVHSDLLRYDPVGDSWIPLAQSPDQHYASQAVYFDGKIYNIGGFDPANNVTNTTRIYDIGMNSWTTGAAMPAALSDMATALWNGIIYVAGGWNGSATVNTLYAYDIGSNTWSTLAPLPQALAVPGFGIINGRLYIAGGTPDGVADLNTLYIYEIENNTWTTGPSLPQAVGNPGSTIYNGQLYLYGGFPSTAITQTYDPMSNAWSNGPDMNVSRYFLYGTAVGDASIVAPGGVDPDGIPPDDNEKFVGGPCSTPTPSATPTPTPRPHPTPRHTPTPHPHPTPRPRH